MRELKVRKVGNSLTMTIPVEVATKLGVKDGDSVYLVEQQYGFELTGFDPEFDEAMKAWQSVRYRYRNALKALA